VTVGIEADLGDGVVGALVQGALAHEEILLTLEEGCCGDVRLGCESLRCGDELFIPLLEEEFVLVLPPAHPLAGKGALTPAALADEPWVTCPRHDSHLRLIAILGNQAPLYPRRAGSLRLAATMVAAGAGIAWLPSSLCPSGCTVAELAASSFKRRVGLCYAPDALRSAAVELGVKPGQMFEPIRVAVCGRKTAPPLFGTLEVLGRETCLARIQQALAKLK
jgi:hypothetical protein